MHENAAQQFLSEEAFRMARPREYVSVVIPHGYDESNLADGLKVDEFLLKEIENQL